MTDLAFPAWVREEAPNLPAPGEGRQCGICGWWKCAGPESTRGSKRDELTEGFDRKAGAKNGLRETCRECNKAIRRNYINGRLEDPEERAKETLRQRAKKGYLSWELWRELREQKRCREWLAEHPFSRPTRGPYGYVYVLMTFAEEVLYVGQTIDVETRLFIQQGSHKYDKDWFYQVALVDVYTYDKADYDEGERWLIKTLNPVYNKVRPKPRRAEPPTPINVVRGAI